MKHIVVFLAFENFDIIKTSFDSIKIADADFFVIENQSQNSNIIKEYFLNQNLKGYIQFQENAAANAMNIFIRDYYDLLSEYDYITFTDGDIFCHNINDTFNEIFEQFHNTNCIISSCDLWLGNLYTNQIKKGINDYVIDMNNNVKNNNNIGQTGNTLVTLKNSHLYLLRDIHYVDTIINSKIETIGGIWYRTTKNIAYHLTWDLYVDGNKYYEWKKQVYPQIWDKTDRNFIYNVLI